MSSELAAVSCRLPVCLELLDPHGDQANFPVIAHFGQIHRKDRGVFSAPQRNRSVLSAASPEYRIKSAKKCMSASRSKASFQGLKKTLGRMRRPFVRLSLIC